MNRWQIFRYILFLGAMIQSIVQSLADTGNDGFITSFELMTVWGIGSLSVMSIILFQFAWTLPAILTRFILKIGMANGPWQIPTVKTRFFTLGDPAQPLHAFVYMLGGGACGMLVSTIIKRQSGDLAAAILFFACQLGLLAGIKILRVTFKEKYTTGPS